jgi:hypothetical protein
MAIMKFAPGLRSFSLILCIIAAGCATAPKEHYHWGNYEELLLAMYVASGSADPFTQIDKLTVDIQQAENTGKAVPPGLYAHLGMMYALNGDASQAEAAFYQERELFPESAVFIDAMMARSLAAGENPNALVQ